MFSKDTLGLHYCCSPLIILAVRIFLALGSDTAPIFEYLQHITKSLQNSSQKLKNNAINKYKFIARLFQTLWRENKGKSEQLYLQWIANYLMIAWMCVAMYLDSLLAMWRMMFWFVATQNYKLFSDFSLSYWIKHTHTEWEDNYL